MKIKIVNTENCTNGLNTKSGVPFQFYNSNSTLEHNHIKMNNSIYMSYDFLSGQWLKHKYYVDLNVYTANGDGKSLQKTFTGGNRYYDIMLWLKFSNWYNKLRDIMAWVGGIVSIIYGIKQILN